LTEEEVFISMVELCALNIYKYDYHIQELLDLLFLMKYKPDEFKEELFLWRKILDQYAKEEK
jgi:hypothetical protein